MKDNSNLCWVSLLSFRFYDINQLHYTNTNTSTYIITSFVIQIHPKYINKYKKLQDPRIFSGFNNTVQWFSVFSHPVGKCQILNHYIFRANNTFGSKP